jgi:c-di-GMP-binding flagellar brake protein YcgR
MRGIGFLKVNQKVEILVDTPGYRGKYVSRIEDLTDNEIVVGIPIVSGSLVPLPVGIRVDVDVICTDAVYRIHTRILKRVLHPFPLLFLAKSEDIERVQRRNYARVDVVLDVEMEKLPSGEEGVVFHGVTRNISGGGMLLSIIGDGDLLREIKEGDFVEISFKIPIWKDPIYAVSKVVREDIRIGDRKDIAIAFVSINEKDRDRIVKFVFERQRELRRRGIL